MVAAILRRRVSLVPTGYCASGRQSAADAASRAAVTAAVRAAVSVLLWRPPASAARMLPSTRRICTMGVEAQVGACQHTRNKANHQKATSIQEQQTKPRAQGELSPHVARRTQARPSPSSSPSPAPPPGWPTSYSGAMRRAGFTTALPPSPPPPAARCAAVGRR